MNWNYNSRTRLPTGRGGDYNWDLEPEEKISSAKDTNNATVVGFSQRSDPSGNRTRGTTSADVVLGSIKESLGNALSGVATLLQSTQGENLLREEKVKQGQEQKKLDRMLADNQKAPGTWDNSVLNAKAKELEANQRLLDAGEQAIAESPILQGVNQVRDFGADLALSGAQDIARAKENTNGFGRFMVDVGAAGTQFLGDAALAALTGGAAVLPVKAVQSFGAGANQAKAAGANLDQQFTYGLGNAVLNLGTEKLFNLATPLKKTYGSGFLDVPLANTGRVDAMKRLLSSAATEGGEEFVESMGQTALQKITFDPDAQWDFSDALYQAGVGATLGSIAADPFLAGFYAEEIENGVLPDSAMYLSETAPAHTLTARQDHMEENKTQETIEPYTKFNYHEDGTVVVTDDWTKMEHPSLRAKYKPYAVVDTLSQHGRQRDRMFYNGEGFQSRQINNGPHGNMKEHPYGISGEHAHDIIWEDGMLIRRTTRDLTNTERRENADIL